MKTEKQTAEDKSFQKFTLVCYFIAFLSFLALIYVWVEGVPSFDNEQEEADFCYKNGGWTIEPSRATYNQLLCGFEYNNTFIEYSPQRIENEEWAEAFGYEVGDYCFTCWDDFSCGSSHNDILREKGVHC